MFNLSRPRKTIFGSNFLKMAPRTATQLKAGHSAAAWMGPDIMKNYAQRVINWNTLSWSYSTPTARTKYMSIGVNP
jgi:hypothetical protein